MSVLNCDECKKDFKFKKNKVRVKNFNNGVQQHFFKCPHCKHKFIFMYQDEEIRNNLNEMDDIKEVIQEKLKLKKDVQVLIDKYEKLYCRNLDLSEEYKKIYGR